MISVCICTHNRCGSLARTLGTLAAQEDVDWDAVEVVVVDNNCADDTAAVVAAAAGRLPIRRVQEPAQGLSHARNRAVGEARGDWLVFTDDDVLLERDWLAAYETAFRRHPDAAFGGGRIAPHWLDGPPAWFRGEHLDLLDGLLVWYDLGAETRPMTAADPTPFGASFAIRRSLARDVGRFRVDLGARGDGVGRGEETEFLRRARRAGAKGVYVGAAHCRHVADPRRFTVAALYRHGRSKADADRAMAEGASSGSTLRAVSYLARGVRQLLLGRGDRFRQCVINAGMQRGLATAGRSGGRRDAARHAG